MNHDTHEKISPADPRITAYAFGELEGDELAHIAAAVQADPELQAAVAELRAFSDELGAALTDEHMAEPVAHGDVAKSRKRRGLLIPFPLHYLATVAAACFAVVVWMRHEQVAPPSLKKESPAMIAFQTQAPPARVALPERAPAKLFSTEPVGEKPAVSGLIAQAQDARNDSKLDTTGERTPALAAAFPAEKPKAAVRVPEAVAAPGPAVVSLRLNDQPKEADKMVAGGAIVVGYVESSGTEGLSTRSFDAAMAPVSLSASTFSVSAEQGRTAPPDAYAHPADSTYQFAASEPLSTFSVDVDTASYANVRRFLTGGHLPPRDAVRIEELINYFPYRYASPTTTTDAKEAVPFAARLDVASAPWAPAHRLVRIGLKARELTTATRPAANLVFLLDVSGSMRPANRLPLVKESLRLLVERLRPDDRVAIVTYAGSSGLALPSTPASRKGEILAALDNLNATGSTNGAMGIHLAYDIAKANFASGGINRVILCTDGDFNVGVTDRGELVRLIEEKARSRVFLSVFGFGMGNLKDHTLESLADKGNGTYGYIDTRREAEKVFVEQVEGTLVTIAKDVKVQVEFNPARVAAYRLVGYENRLLKKEDFNNDAVDAGDIGAGHTVTAFYEIVPVGVDEDGTIPRPVVDPLKYQVSAKPAPTRNSAGAASKELLTVKIRYKAPEGDVSRKQDFPLIDTGADFSKADGEFQFAAAVAAWGMLLRDSPHKGSATFEQVLGWAENGLGDDAGGYRAEFIQLVRRSADLGR